MHLKTIILSVLLATGVAIAKPPPHAPAHGYRIKHQGQELVYDRDLSVYRVDERPGVFFFDGHYYTLRDDRWFHSEELTDDDRWELAESDQVPSKLAVMPPSRLQLEVERD